MESIINILPEFVANQIAAGEVVNRPASAVKELLENSIDAGAKEIELHIVDAGRTLIQVVDNGCGMSPEDAERCFLPHATSKLGSTEDLQHIRTMGFRGEALASIAAVAQVELRTRPAGEEIGTRICIEGGKITEKAACACPPGSCFMVKNLYFNTPARRQFLKSEEVEFRYVEDEFNRVALAHPEISFAFYRNNQRIFFLEPGNLKKRIVQLMGKAFESRIVKVSESLPGIQVGGYICSPDYSVKGRSKQFLFANRRYIRHGGISNAVEKAYSGLLPEGKSPAFFLYLEVEPESIDVNIHPTKTEIRFKDEKLLYGLMLSAVKHALGIHQMGNVLDFESSQALPYIHKAKGVPSKSPEIELQAGYNPFEKPASAPRQDNGPAWAKLASGMGLDNGKGNTMRSFSPSYREAYAENFALMQEAMQVQEPENQLCIDCFNENEAERQKALSEADTPLNPDGTEGAGEEKASANHEIGNSTVTEAKVKPVRIFQIFNSYIVTPLKSGLAIIDQEAASERIIYNNYALSKDGNMPSQRTLFPQTLEFSASDTELLRDLRNDLESLGWSIEWVGGHSFLVNALPPGIQESRAQEILENLLVSYTRQLMHAKKGRWENIAASLARELAVKRGTPLPDEEILYMLNQLFSGPDPEISPSGKRVFRLLDPSELAGFFGD